MKCHQRHFNRAGEDFISRQKEREKEEKTFTLLQKFIFTLQFLRLSAGLGDDDASRG